jgi:protein SCO1/2
MRRLILLASLLALLSLVACSEPAPPAPAFRNTDITGAEFGRSLAGMSDPRGKPVELADFKGRALVVFFGYTSCPDVCPTTLARLAEVMKALGKDASRVQVLLVTLDPERDSAEKLSAYVTAFDPSFVGVRGDAAATEAVAREFKVFYSKVRVSDTSAQHAAHGHAGHHHDEGDYAIDHSAAIYVLDPAGRIRLYVKDDAAVDAIASDLRLLLAGK